MKVLARNQKRTGNVNWLFDLAFAGRVRLHLIAEIWSYLHVRRYQRRGRVFVALKTREILVIGQIAVLERDNCEISFLCASMFFPDNITMPWRGDEC